MKQQPSLSQPRFCALALLSLSLLHWTQLSLALDHHGVHILFLTDCTLYSDWMSVAMAFSYKNSGQQGSITRVMCCTDEEKAAYPNDMLHVMKTHVAPSFEFNKKTNDHYAPFNKPGAVLDFMKHGHPEADWMLVIDSDMLLRHPFDPHAYKLTKGNALSAEYTYMIGCENELAKKHIPEIKPRKDKRAGPEGRRCDEVGAWVYMHREDLAKVAPLWLSYTVDVREDTASWNLTGDSYVEPGGKAWISEMYGYAFACAKSNVWHTWDTEVMFYPSYNPPLTAPPKLIHYGLEFSVGDLDFDKHEHFKFNVRKCPPWKLVGDKRKEGVFRNAPRLRELRKQEDASKFYHNLIAIETVATFNAGFCDYHLDKCPASEQLYTVCADVVERYIEIKEAVREFEATKLGCMDRAEQCGGWAKEGECEANPDFMNEECSVSCGRCKEGYGRVVANENGTYHGQTLDPQKMPGVIHLKQKLLDLEKKLGPIKRSPPDIVVPSGRSEKTPSGVGADKVVNHAMDVLMEVMETDDDFQAVDDIQKELLSNLDSVTEAVTSNPTAAHDATSLGEEGDDSDHNPFSKTTALKHSGHADVPPHGDLASPGGLALSIIEHDSSSPSKVDVSIPDEDDVTSQSKDDVSSPDMDDASSGDSEGTISWYKDDVTSDSKDAASSGDKDDVTSENTDDVTSLYKDDVTTADKDDVTTADKDDVTTAEKDDVTTADKDDVTRLDVEARASSLVAASKRNDQLDGGVSDGNDDGDDDNGDRDGDGGNDGDSGQDGDGDGGSEDGGSSDKNTDWTSRSLSRQLGADVDAAGLLDLHPYGQSRWYGLAACLVFILALCVCCGAPRKGKSGSKSKSKSSSPHKRRPK